MQRGLYVGLRVWRGGIELCGCSHAGGRDKADLDWENGETGSMGKLRDSGSELEMPLGQLSAIKSLEIKAHLGLYNHAGPSSEGPSTWRTRAEYE